MKHRDMCRCNHHRDKHEELHNNTYECNVCSCNLFFSEVVMCYECEEETCKNLDPDAYDTSCCKCYDSSISRVCRPCIEDMI